MFSLPTRAAEPTPPRPGRRDAPIRVVAEPVGPDERLWYIRPLGPFHVEAQDELVEIGGSQYRVHPAGPCSRSCPAASFDELVEDVLVNGLREPVVVSGDELIDGRNPAQACAAAGVVPEVGELGCGTDVVSWMMSVNVHRRHLDASQRALQASRLSALSDEVTLSQAGEMMGRWPPRD